MSIEKHYHTRLTMALDDLLRCRSYAKQMLVLPIGVSFSSERTVYEGLFVALIVSYGRVFTSSNTTETEFKIAVSQAFGDFKKTVTDDLEFGLRRLHERIMNRRHTAIAHSDAKSRNYKHYGDSPLGCGDNPFYPYEHDEVARVLELVEILISAVGSEQLEVGKVAFANPLFQIPDEGT